jgi:hypothetical protein
MKTIDGINWINVDYQLPPERELVLLTGSSGYVTHKKFITAGYYDNEYRPPIDGAIRYLDVQDDALLDRGWRPTHWAKMIQLP